MKGVVVSEFKNNCGDELLGTMVELSAGVEFSNEDRELIAIEYGNCATTGMQNAMNVVYEKLNDFADEEQKIFAEVNSE